jgi:long-chain fatty acid transport protein
VQRSIPILITLILSAAAGSARAGGFATGRYAGEHGHVATDHPTAIYFNPAGLALGVGWRIYAEGILAWRTVEYQRPEGAISNVVDGEGQAGTPSDATDVNSGKASLSNFAAAPFLGAVTDFGVPNLGVGLAFYVPFGGQAKWDKDDRFEGDSEFPGAEDGVQRWHTIEGEIRSLYLSLGGAYRFPGPRLAVGAGFNLIRSNVTTVRARTPQGTDDVIAADGGIAEGRSLIDTNGTHISASVGINWEAVPGLWIGASYQSQPGFGNFTQSGTLDNKFGSGPTLNDPIRLEQELPDITRLGVRYQPMPELELRLSGDYQRWSVFEHQCFLEADDPDANCALDEDGQMMDDAQSIIVNIPREWKDTYGVRAGASYWFAPELEVNGGVNFDSSAVPDRTIESSLIDANKVIGIAGVRWAAMPDSLLLALTVNNVFYFERDVSPREQGDIGTVSPSAVPDGAGKYTQNVIFVNLGAEYRF